ncbi:hypothetical protein BN134_3555 [Cronobacter dublinensis 1210]|uniref:Uncharacterized protein n=1 Tax=Cronobacter dublinensis 1210 TaxID=1208656 RepID=A0ABM9QB97_9ENTR|nr:hypothetical protein BN134_3555 [Cronobacter dublinensis 1210]
MAAAMLVSTLHTAKADECKLNTAGDHVNLNVPVAVQLPLTTSSAMSGTVLYKKEAPLSLLSGMHKNINMQCLETIRKKLAGRIPGARVARIFMPPPLTAWGSELPRFTLNQAQEKKSGHSLLLHQVWISAIKLSARTTFLCAWK